jgi:multicomponent Na+:H+ antiporter subunit D
VPLTFGFLAKWKLTEAALSGGAIWIVAVVAISSLLSLIYVGRMLEAVFFRAPPLGGPRGREAPVGVLFPLWVLAGLSVWFGFDAALPEGLAHSAAQALFGAAP